MSISNLFSVAHKMICPEMHQMLADIHTSLTSSANLESTNNINETIRINLKLKKIAISGSKQWPETLDLTDRVKILQTPLISKINRIGILSTKGTETISKEASLRKKPLLTSILSMNKAESSLKRKTASFHPKAMVFLIPTRKEYRQAGLVSELWRTINEERHSQKKSNAEIINYSRLHSNYDLRAVRRKLYQPGPEETS